MDTVILSQNLDKALPLVKTLGAVTGAAILLYLILVLVRFLGCKIERKGYDAYCQKCQAEGTAPLPYEEYVARRAKGEKVLWKREDEPRQVATLVDSDKDLDNEPIEQDNIASDVEQKETQDAELSVQTNRTAISYSDPIETDAKDDTDQA